MRPKDYFAAMQVRWRYDDLTLGIISHHNHLRYSEWIPVATEEELAAALVTDPARPLFLEVHARAGRVRFERVGATKYSQAF